MSMYGWNELEWSRSKCREKRMVVLMYLFDSVVHKECIIAPVFKMPIVIIHDFYFVICLSVLAVVINRCFGTVL